MAIETTDGYRVGGGVATPVYVVNNAVTTELGGGDTLSVTLSGGLDASTAHVDVATINGAAPLSKGTLLASGAHTGSNASEWQVNKNAVGVMVFLNISAVPGDGSTCRVQVQTRDPVTAKTAVLTTGSTQTATTSTVQVYVIHPTGDTSGEGITAGKKIGLPQEWRVEMIHTGSGSFTYSLGYAYLYA
jgi:hypothetical protein